MFTLETEVKKRFLTLKEANSMLDEIGPLFQRLQSLNNAIEMFGSVEITYDDEFSELANYIKRNRNKQKLYLEFYNLLNELLDRGCIVKDVKGGLADFYSYHQGKEIFLCWQFGEDKIKFWHEVEIGFKGRKPVSLLKK